MVPTTKCPTSNTTANRCAERGRLVHSPLTPAAPNPKVFRARQPIPPGFARDSGKHLWLLYHRDNDAWAIATEFGR